MNTQAQEEYTLVGSNGEFELTKTQDEKRRALLEKLVAWGLNSLAKRVSDLTDANYKLLSLGFTLEELEDLQMNEVRHV